MEIQIAVAKTSKYAVSESGDTLEVVERPNGGVSVVLADGQSSGKGAKVISAMVVHKVINMLADGIRDGAAARAASDFLYTEKNGKVTATLNILSADFQTGTLVITCNNPTPIFISHHGKIDCLRMTTSPIGSNRNIRPAITELALECDITVVMYTDGLVFAGDRYGQELDMCTLLDSLLEDQDPTSQQIADTLLTQAIKMDQGRPNDDMSVVVLKTVASDADQIRRMTVRFPVPPTSGFC
ncbi:MAG: PP2C family protein-serine/threonine phosphatase [Anaerolineaceae bacterium]